MGGLATAYVPYTASPPSRPYYYGISQTVTVTQLVFSLLVLTLIVFELSVVVALRLSSIGYETNMYLSSFSISDTFVIRIVVLYLTIILFFPFFINLNRNHVQFVSGIMPVTTRSQFRRSASISQVSLKVVSNDSDTLISETLPVATHVSQASISHSIMEMDTRDYFCRLLSMEISSDQSNSSDLALDDHSFSHLKLSKFQNSEISNGNLSFDPGISCHNISISNQVTMEADCKDNAKMASSSSGISDMNALFDAISAKFTSETDKISQNFKHVVEEHMDFKQEVRAELDALRQLIRDQTTPLPLDSSSLHQTSSSSDPSVLLPTVSNVNTPTVMPAATGLSSSELQNQMILMMTESFSKLSTAFSESKGDTKTEWPKFNGDTKKFRSWYLGVMTQLSLHPWQELYDPVTHDVVTSTQNSTLNGKLYAKVILALEGSAYKNFISRKHLRANGILLLSELVQTYKPRNVPEMIAAKTVDFGEE